jgi:hypothetical protein
VDDRKNLSDHETLIRRVCATAQNQFAEFTEEKLLYLTFFAEESRMMLKGSSSKVYQRVQ